MFFCNTSRKIDNTEKLYRTALQKGVECAFILRRKLWELCAKSMKNYINIVAGRPGSGKTIWACKEAATLAADPNNTVIYIGHQKEFGRIVRSLSQEHPKNLLFARLSNAAEAIGRAIDLANAFNGMFENMKLDEEQADRKMVYLFYDQCRYDLFYGRRDILDAAAKAGVFVYVICQVYSQVDKGDEKWLRDQCHCMVISKGRPPREALLEEVTDKYRGEIYQYHEGE